MSGGRESNHTNVTDDARLPDRISASSGPFRLDNLSLLGDGADGRIRVDGITLVLDNEGVTVVRTDELNRRVLPWSALETHVVEPWTAGVSPEWWIDPEPHGKGGGTTTSTIVIDPDASHRPLSRSESGAILSLRTAVRTYRFFVPDGHSDDLRTLMAEVAQRHCRPVSPTSANTGSANTGSATTGSATTGSATTVVARPPRQQAGSSPRTPWTRVRPLLVALAILFVGAAVTLILLQSAGTIHVPLLGGADHGTVLFRSR